MGAIILLLFTLPILSPNQQGVDTTPRYFFPVTPLLAFFCFKVFSKWKPKAAKWMSLVLILYSFLFIYTFIKIVKSYTSKFPTILKVIDSKKSLVNIYFQKDLLIPGELMRIRDTQNSYFRASTQDELESLLQNLKKHDIHSEQISIYFMGKLPEFLKDKNIPILDAGNIPDHSDWNIYIWKGYLNF